MTCTPYTDILIASSHLQMRAQDEPLRSADPRDFCPKVCVVRCRASTASARGSATARAVAAGWALGDEGQGAEVKSFGKCLLAGADEQRVDRGRLPKVRGEGLSSSSPSQIRPIGGRLTFPGPPLPPAPPPPPPGGPPSSSWWPYPACAMGRDRRSIPLLNHQQRT